MRNEVYYSEEGSSKIDTLAVIEAFFVGEFSREIIIEEEKREQ